MASLANLQLIGPAALFGAIAGGEASVYALAQAPTSELLWYLNLEVFGILHKSNAVFRAYASVPYAQVWFVAIPILAAAWAGFYARNRFLITLSTNLSFVYACFLVYSWYLAKPSMRFVSLSAIPVPSGPDLFMFALLGAASFFSFYISQLFYIREMRCKR